MRSRASIHGHPIHPMLIPFPFAFLYGGAAFDLLARWTSRAHLAQTGRSLQSAGLATALAAAAPGLVDYLFTVPPDSSGKQRATKHMLANLGAVGLFALARAARAGRILPPATTLALNLAGAGLMGIGGWLGGTLVYRNEIGVDVRYAGAGKWKEARLSAAPGTPVRIGASDELGIDQMKLLHLDGKRVVLARTAQGYTAFDDRCVHRGGSLAGGTLIGDVVQCPWHGSQFDVWTGAVRRGPATFGISVYRVEDSGGQLLLHS
ncbi:MAG TPA: DUF2231 domain-containing protein [Vicinamibacterales bacterium]|nr:DUF2231 domain-containing protein [Vicinamibacterales bacterium]